MPTERSENKTGTTKENEVKFDTVSTVLESRGVAADPLEIDKLATTNLEFPFKQPLPNVARALGKGEKKDKPLEYGIVTIGNQSRLIIQLTDQSTRQSHLLFFSLSMVGGKLQLGTMLLDNLVIAQSSGQTLQKYIYSKISKTAEKVIFWRVPASEELPKVEKIETEEEINLERQKYIDQTFDNLKTGFGALRSLKRIPKKATPILTGSTFKLPPECVKENIGSQETLKKGVIIIFANGSVAKLPKTIELPYTIVGKGGETKVLVNYDILAVVDLTEVDLGAPVKQTPQNVETGKNLEPLPLLLPEETDSDLFVQAKEVVTGVQARAVSVQEEQNQRKRDFEDFLTETFPGQGWLAEELELIYDNLSPADIVIVDTEFQDYIANLDYTNVPDENLPFLIVVSEDGTYLQLIRMEAIEIYPGGAIIAIPGLACSSRGWGSGSRKWSFDANNVQIYAIRSDFTKFLATHEKQINLSKKDTSVARGLPRPLLGPKSPAHSAPTSPYWVEGLAESTPSAALPSSSKHPSWLDAPTYETTTDRPPKVPEEIVEVSEITGPEHQSPSSVALKAVRDELAWLREEVAGELDGLKAHNKSRRLAAELEIARQRREIKDLISRERQKLTNLVLQEAQVFYEELIASRPKLHRILVEGQEEIDKLLPAIEPEIIVIAETDKNRLQSVLKILFRHFKIVVQTHKDDLQVGQNYIVLPDNRYSYVAALAGFATSNFDQAAAKEGLDTDHELGAEEQVGFLLLDGEAEPRIVEKLAEIKAFLLMTPWEYLRWLFRK